MMRTFTGEALREVAFPLGGIGTGTISLGGRGNLRDWEIFNRPGKGKNLPYTFFALWAKPEGGEAVARVLERRYMPPYPPQIPTAHVSGLPRLKEATFLGGYPLAGIDFEDNTLPVQVRLDALNPFIPMNDRDSGLPMARFRWTLTNPGGQPVEASVVFSLLNACGYDGVAQLSNRFCPLFCENLNECVEDAGLRGIRMSCAKYPTDHPQFGTMAVATMAETVSRKTRWERAGWWDDAQEFWDDFREDGLLSDRHAASPSPDGQTDVGSVSARVVLAPGESAQIPFYLAWHFPNLTNHWNDGEPAVLGQRIGNWYASQWPDAWSVARYAHENWDRLETETKTFARTLFESTLPEAVLDAASANASILRTTTCLRTEDGRFHAFEGCSDNRGCCPMNCTHVWNYAWTVAHLFPQLERSTRLTDFQHNTRESGDMAFRTLLPLLPNTLWAFKPAADGQMGTIIRAYREWLQCGDREFLRAVWPGIVKALEFAWQPGSWDADKDGVMEGEQHNTYDIEFYGPNTMCGLFYLAALRAAEEMALSLDEKDRAVEYRRVFESGSRGYQELFNGDYFVQRVVMPSGAKDEHIIAETHPPSIQPGESEPRYQYGPGCLADQVLGQWMAHNVGLGHLLPKEQVQSAVAAIHRHNFRRDLTQHDSVQRVYAVNDEAGLLLCTWSSGGRPRYPFPYADEVWTGIEYHVAAHLIYEGLIEEGLEIVEAVRSRHAGWNRNPWDEYECGHHYARAMSSWNLLLALSGYHYDAAKGHLAFDPKINADDFRCFFSAGTAWGLFSQQRDGEGYRATVEVRWGELALRSVGLNLGAGSAPEVRLDGQAVRATVDGSGCAVMADSVALRAGQALTVQGVPRG